jgi:hypothetical protein
MKTKAYAAQSAIAPLAPLNVRRREPSAHDVQIQILVIDMASLKEAL